MHIPKTGGRSFRDSVLSPVFGPRLLLDYGDAPLSHPTAERTRRALEYVPPPDLPERYDCVHGHFLATKYASATTPCAFATWFRDPVQRVLSRFYYGKRSRAEGKVVTPGMTLQEFCEIERFHNVYAKYLWNFDLGRLDFVGITEDYANGVAVFCRMFELHDRGEIATTNVNPEKKPEVPYEVDRQTRCLIRRTNREDFEIYEEARVINRRLQRRHLERRARVNLPA